MVAAATSRCQLAAHLVATAKLGAAGAFSTENVKPIEDFKALFS
jgi:hypothetical protein